MTTTTRTFTPDDVEDAALDILAALESDGRPAVTSPTAVAAELARRGFPTMVGPVWAERPDRDAFDAICAVLARRFRYRVAGNVRLVSL